MFASKNVGNVCYCQAELDFVLRFLMEVGKLVVRTEKTDEGFLPKTRYSRSLEGDGIKLLWTLEIWCKEEARFVYALQLFVIFDLYLELL